jgi:hypothetical protein
MRCANIPDKNNASIVHNTETVLNVPNATTLMIIDTSTVTTTSTNATLMIGMRIACTSFPGLPNISLYLHAIYIYLFLPSYIFYFASIYNLMTCKTGDVKCKTRQGIIIAAIIIFVIVILYVTGCGCFPKLSKKFPNIMSVKHINMPTFPVIDTSKCPTCKPTICPPRVKCPDCTRSKIQKKRAFELDANKYVQTSLQEKRSKCSSCSENPCICMSKTCGRVIAEPSVSRNGVYSSCIDKMVFN